MPVTPLIDVPVASTCTGNAFDIGMHAIIDIAIT